MSPAEYTTPPSGFLVVCMALGKYVTVPSDLDRLAWVIGSTMDEAVKKWPDVHTPIQVFELGRELVVHIDYRVKAIRFVEKGEPQP